MQKAPVTITEEQEQYFEKNYPLHHLIIQRMIRTGEARLVDSPTN